MGEQRLRATLYKASPHRPCSTLVRMSIAKHKDGYSSSSKTGMEGLNPKLRNKCVGVKMHGSGVESIADRQLKLKTSSALTSQCLRIVIGQSDRTLASPASKSREKSRRLGRSSVLMRNSFTVTRRRVTFQGPDRRERSRYQDTLAASRISRWVPFRSKADPVNNDWRAIGHVVTCARYSHSIISDFQYERAAQSRSVLCITMLLIAPTGAN